jgi:hypothetical protein
MGRNAAASASPSLQNFAARGIHRRGFALVACGYIVVAHPPEARELQLTSCPSAQYARLGFVKSFGASVLQRLWLHLINLSRVFRQMMVALDTEVHGDHSRSRHSGAF